jgi:hypothetical protein
MICRKISALPHVSINKDGLALLRVCLGCKKMGLPATNAASFHVTLTDSEMSLDVSYKEYIKMAILKDTRLTLRERWYYLKLGS